MARERDAVDIRVRAEVEVSSDEMSHKSARYAVAVSACLLSVGALTSGCSSPKPAPTTPPVLQLWGDLKPVVSVKELMRDFIDPASDYVFDSIATISTKDGDVQTLPKT